MQLTIMSLDGEAAGSIELPDAIFGLEPRPDILHRCVRWQLAKRQRGTHDVKNRACGKTELVRSGQLAWARRIWAHSWAHTLRFSCGLPEKRKGNDERRRFS